MSLGTGGNPWSGNPTKNDWLIGAVMLKANSGNNLHVQYLPRNLQTKRERGEEARIQIF